MIEALLYQPTSQHRAMYDLEGDTMPETFVHVAAGTRPAYWFSGSQFTFIVTSEEAGGSYHTSPEEGLHIPVTSVTEMVPPCIPFSPSVSCRNST